MVGTRNETLIKNELIRYISSLGLDVKTITKARGNRGFFKKGRIDISNTLDDFSSIKVLLHEFAHYTHHYLDNKMTSLELVMGEDNKTIRDELLRVTMFVDESALCKKLNSEREKLKIGIKNLSNTIKLTYPKFSISDDFKEFRKYARWSDLKYLEKYDRVKVQSWSSAKTYSIAKVREDFPDIPEVFVNYLNLKSKQRKRAKISRRINKLAKYYNEPCELFARFIEGLYIDIDKVKELAPISFENFLKLYNQNKYNGLREVFSIVRIIL